MKFARISIFGLLFIQFAKTFEPPWCGYSMAGSGTQHGFL